MSDPSEKTHTSNEVTPASAPSSWNEIWERGTLWVKRAAIVASTCGFGLTTIYFIRMRWLPIDNFTAIGGIAALVFSLTVVLLISLAISAGLPGWVFFMTIDPKNDCTAGWFLSASPERASRGVSPGRVMAWSAFHVAAPVLLIFSYFLPKYFSIYGTVGYVQVPLVAALVTAMLMYARDYPLPAAHMDGLGKPVKASRQKALLPRLAISCMVAIASAVPMLIFLELLGSSEYGSATGKLEVLASTIFIALFCAFTNMMTVSHQLRSRSRGLQHTISHVFILLMAVAAAITSLGVWGRIQDRIMEIASVRVSNATIILRDSGCAPLRNVGILPPAEGASAAAASGCVLNNVTIVSRLGARWPVTCDEGAASHGDRIEVRSEDVTNVLTRTASAPTLAIPPQAKVNFCPRKP